MYSKFTQQLINGHNNSESQYKRYALLWWKYSSYHYIRADQSFASSLSTSLTQKSIYKNTIFCALTHQKTEYDLSFNCLENAVNVLWYKVKDKISDLYLKKTYDDYKKAMLISDDDICPENLRWAFPNEKLYK